MGYEEQMRAALRVIPPLPEGEYRLVIFQDSVAIEPMEPNLAEETVHIGGIRGDIPRAEFEGHYEDDDKLEPLDLEEEGAVEKQIRQLEEALPPPDRLELLANWFEADDRLKGRDPTGTEVQDDLRSWAKKIREVKP